MPDISAPQAVPQPDAGPMAKPEPKDGMKEQALVKVRMAAKIMQSVLPVLGYDTEEGKAALAIVGQFAKHFGKSEDDANELLPEEAKQMAAIAAPVMGQGGSQGPAPPMGARVPGVGQLPGMQ